MERPKVTIEFKEEDSKSASCIVKPLRQGMGTTLGNSIRRVLLSSIPGAAVTNIQFMDGSIYHEFSPVEGMKEDVIDIIMNLKKLVVRMESEEPETLSLRYTGKGPITASLIDAPLGVEVINKDLEIARLEEESSLDMEMLVEKGYGYSTSEDNKKQKSVISMIPIDSIFTPVARVSYTVGETRVGQHTNFDQLTLNVVTDGSITPKEAILQAAEVLIKEIAVFLDDEERNIASMLVEQKEDAETAKLSAMKIEELALSTRAFNSLKAQKINNLAELTQLSETDILSIKGVGGTVAEEIKNSLSKHDLKLRDDR